MDASILRRPRRNRRTASLRESLAECHLSTKNLIWPLFVTMDPDSQSEIPSMPGQYRWGWKRLIQEIRSHAELGGFAIFPVLRDDEKDAKCSQATNTKHPFIDIMKRIREAAPDSILISDIALDPFSSDGHDGLVRDGQILNDETVAILAEMACLHASTGFDFVAPSDMMDGRVRALRRALDAKGYTQTGILAYSAKYASCFYGPFRDALASAPRFGDKKTYQMDPRNGREAILEAELDVEEGADIIMVKPGLPYLDIIARLRDRLTVPLAAYNVSGEYAMIKFAAREGALNERSAVLETLYSFRRAGADLILTYHAADAATWLSQK